MSSNRERLTIGDIAVSYQQGAIRSNSQLGIGKTKYLKMQDLDGNGGYSYNNLAVTDATDEEIEDYKLKKGDFLINVRNSREIVGKTCVINAIPNNTIFNHMLVRIGFKENVSSVFVNARFNTTFFKKKLDGVKAGTTTIIALYQRDLYGLPIFLPEYKEQQKIAKTLSTIDDKIELNNKINSELEAMAKEIYEYWFVQFDFPDENGKPYKSSGGKMVYNDELKREIPEGWSVENIFSAVDVLYGYPFSTELFTEERTEKPLVRIRDILEGTNSAYTTENVDETYKLSKGDLIVGMDGNFHINYRCDDTSYLNQRCVRFRKKQDDISMLLLMFQITPFIKMREKTAKGSTVGHLSDKDIKSINVLIPNIDCKIFDGILRELINNRIENKQLTELRDFLLPMLMNGQVTVK